MNKKNRWPNSYLLILAVSIFLFYNPKYAQPQEIDIPENPIIFKASMEPGIVRSEEEVRVVIAAKIKKGWHIYSLIKADDSPIPPTLITWINPLLNRQGPAYETNPIVQFDPVIETTLGYHENKVHFYQNFKVPAELTPGVKTLTGSIRYQVCDDRICLLPETKTLSVSFEVEKGEQRPEFSFMNRTIDDLPTQGFALPNASSLNKALAGGFIPFVLLAVTMGMIAWLTPCVFPMIPITISFFSKQVETNKKRLVKLAFVFTSGIVLTYTGIGLIVTAIFGVANAASIASNPWINLAIAGLFTLFALSLMGVFEMRLPAGLIQKVDSASRSQKGYLGAVLMGTAFTLTAFTCTIQFVGTLLVAASQGEWMWPIIGMLIFAVIFALPFLLLALFPKWISRFTSKAGSWMIRLKFIVGLLELMAVTKFVSNADLVWGWGIINREVVLISWAAILLIGSLIILGIIPLKGSGLVKRRPVVLLFGGVFFALTIYFGIGASGRPLDGWTESFLPPRLYSDQRPSVTNSNTGYRDEDLTWLDTLEGGLIQAQSVSKPIFLDFTGYTCINCRWMEKNVFVQEEIYQKLDKNFIKVRLYTDGGENHEENQELQIQRFKTIALPFYVILSPENAVLAKTSGISGPEAFNRFLDSAAKN